MREEKLRERLLRNERDSRFLRKDSNDRKVVEEVFDRLTLRAFNVLLTRGDIDYLNGVVASGKEARVYWGVAMDGSPRAVKVYLSASAEFKRRMRYIAGDRRFTKVPASTRAIVKLWVQKEYKNLQTATESGVRVPRPFAFSENVLIMEYIGTPPAPAPTFAETEVDEDDYRWTIETVKLLYRSAGLVHADLSEFNIFKLDKERVLFDMGSAVLTTHPEAREFLLRDVTNIGRFFRKRAVASQEPAEIVEEITS